MSIVHKALKKAEKDEQVMAQLKSPPPLTPQSGATKKPSVKRVFIIFLVFLLNLCFVLYYPSYYKNRKTIEAKKSIIIKSEPPKVEPKAPAEHADKELSNESPESLNEKGISYYNNNDYDNAYKYFSSAIEKDKGNYELYNNLGLVLKQKKNYKEALLNYQSALKINKYYTECYNNMGVLYDQLGEYNDAVKAFTQAINLDNNYKESYFNLAVTYEKMGDYKLAQKNYNRYLTFFKGGNSDFLRGIRKKVEILSKL